MNTLTPNRILQQGDEYRDNGKWKLIPNRDFGLQIQFTDYKEVRRPNETLRETPDTAKDAPTEAPKRVASPTPISPDRSQSPAKAESDKSPVASHSATGDASYLPTVVSKKAHGSVKVVDPTDNRGTKDMPVIITKIYHPQADVTWHSSEPPTRWIGRNGTFSSVGLKLIRNKSGTITIKPVGKRGLAKNAEIEFPINAIPQIIHFLTDNKTPTT
jgi:hypothetical protein